MHNERQPRFRNRSDSSNSNERRMGQPNVIIIAQSRLSNARADDEEELMVRHRPGSRQSVDDANY